MKKLLFIPFAMLILAVAFNACKKDDPEPSKEEILAGSSSKSWKLTKMMADTVDITEIFDDCSKDNLWIFYSDKRFEMNEGATKCDENDPQSTTGVWSFNSEKTVISITLDGDLENLSISELTNSTLRGKTTDDDGNTIEFTFAAQ